MKVISMPLLLAGSLGFLASSAIAAPPTATSQIPAQPSAREIFEQQIALRIDAIDERGAFEGMHKTDREDLILKQDRLLQLLDDRDNFDGLSADQRIELFNTLETVKAVVANADDDRKICERARVVGSNRFQLVCMTAAQKQEYRENSRDILLR